MGKVKKRQPIKHTNHHDNPDRARKAVIRRQHSQSNPQIAKVNKKYSSASNAVAVDRNNHGKLKTPFCEQDRILLVGEGDFTFALSLAQAHSVGSITATCFDSKDILEQKYPEVTRTIRKLIPIGQEVGEESSQIQIDTAGGNEEEWDGFSSAAHSEVSETESPPGRAPRSSSTRVFYGIDATKLSSTHRKALRPHSPFTKIVFNFPHVGGLSTDVNRQVRSNQQLLVNFFKAAKPLLATASHPAHPKDHVGEEEDIVLYDSDNEIEIQNKEYLKHGQILVTLFEGEPYTLWNIRDLARHSGLKVLESFKFSWAAYPGYRHARTIGDITTGRDRSDEGKRKGAWRGEERDARCYILALKDDDDGRPAPGSRKRKNSGDDNESD